MYSIKSLFSLMAGVLAMTSLQADTPTPHTVASDRTKPELGQPHLLLGSPHKDPASHSQAKHPSTLGDPIAFGYSGFIPDAAYAVRISFDSDADRVVKIKADEEVLEPALSLPKGATFERSFNIPSAAIKDGELVLTIEKVEGPNASVVDVLIQSSKPKPLSMLPVPERPVPRLSPRPLLVDGCLDPILPLSGNWSFSPSPENGFQNQIAAPPTWHSIQVPGEWAMQGFDVPQNASAGYWRSFDIPKDWKGKRFILRCNAVNSDCVVWVNGQSIGKHAGGFTPFEFDITDAVKMGASNTIALSVLSDTVADKLASASKYAKHSLGGITRSIELLALPEVHLASLQIQTDFDADYKNATLKVAFEVAGASPDFPKNLTAELSLADPSGARIAMDPAIIAISGPKTSVTIPITTPRKWDSEHPNLYRLDIQLAAGGRMLQKITQRVGFREIEVRANELFVNGAPVKLRGVNRHEVHPLTGRSLPDGWHRKDIELFREGNVNLVRTAHYPPDQALMDAADELGMFIECEAPFCWAPANGHSELVWQQTAEMAVAFRNHPSILMWSVANESKWGRHFVESSTLLRRLDPTRPLVFNDNGSIGDPKFIQLQNGHYWGMRSVKTVAEGLPQPFYLGEDVHLNAYNRLELATDPALRDLWGECLLELWDGIWKTKGSLGFSIWAGIDDTFYLKVDQTVGYGTWGVLDGWRRKKPEFWNMKKTFSPVRIVNAANPKIDKSTITLDVENRYLFTNLKDVGITWQLGERTGSATVDIPAGKKGTLTLDVGTIPANPPELGLKFEDPRGFIADEFRLQLPGDPKPEKPAIQKMPVKLVETPDAYTIKSGDREWQINRRTGLLESTASQPASGPQLMVLKLNATGESQMEGKTKVWDSFTPVCRDWKCASVTATSEPDGLVVTVKGQYTEAEGTFHYRFSNGNLRIDYDFTMLEDINPRQIGLVFTLPATHEILAWDRIGKWDFYPEDHIARLKGSVKASEGFEATSVGPRTEPQHPWRLDNLPAGNNDFCSTKHSVRQASLSDGNGSIFSIEGEGKTHIRCWKSASGIHLLAANFSHGGSERFLKSFTKRAERPLKKGQAVTGSVKINE
jgi:hypothetical protein